MSDAIGKLLYHQIQIMELIEHLINKSPLNSHWFDFVAHVALKSNSLSRQETIIALELIGGSLGICDTYFEEDFNPFAVMFRCWRKAMSLRYFPADGEPLLPKIPHSVGVQSTASSVVFGSVAEVMSMKKLNLLEEHVENSRANPDLVVRLRCICEVFRQCLLVIRKICSQATHVYLYPCYLQNLYEFGSGTLRILIFFMKLRISRSPSTLSCSSWNKLENQIPNCFL
jgi:hypothetical protein